MNRYIEINKDNVIYNVEAIIRKVLDVRQATDISAYHIQPDRDLRIDVEVLHRNLEKRDADIRVVMAAYICGCGCLGFENNELRNDDDTLLYSLNLPDNWKKSFMRPLEVYIHDYLVKGILYDYLIDKLPDIAPAYGAELDSLEDSIKSALGAREGGVVRRPLQPF